MTTAAFGPEASVGNSELLERMRAPTHRTAEELDAAIHQVLGAYLSGATGEHSSLTGSLHELDAEAWDQHGSEVYGERWPEKRDVVVAHTDPQTRQITTGPNADDRTLVHEAIHALSDHAVCTQMGTAWDEALTEYFALDVCTSQKLSMGFWSEYQNAIPGIEALVTLLGSSGEAILAGALFRGEVDALRQAVCALPGGDAIWAILLQHGPEHWQSQTQPANVEVDPTPIDGP